VNETLELPVVRAVSKAYVQHEVWLASLGCDGVLGKVNPKPHPFAGRGVGSGDVAEVLVVGTTFAAWWRAKMYAYGLDSMHGQLPFSEADALIRDWLAESPLAIVTRGDVMRTFHMLKRAAELGLIAGERFYGRWHWKPV
jgi:hypothetical protein